MSTGAECRFYETQPGTWIYRIQCWPYGDTDEYDENGPFESFEDAKNHLISTYPDPGGWSTFPFKMMKSLRIS